MMFFCAIAVYHVDHVQCNGVGLVKQEITLNTLLPKHLYEWE